MATSSDHRSSAPTERLPDPESLERWFRSAGLASRPLGTTAVELVETRSLREALFDVVGAVARRDPVSSRALRELNRVAQHPVPASRLVIDGGELREHAPELDAAAALAAVARDAIDLLSGPESALLRECEARDCSGIYVDRSHGGRRRWCSTARCGNRARVAAHRARGRSSETGERRG